MVAARNVGWLFVAIGIVFAVVAARSYVVEREGGRVARGAWWRVAVIFVIVGMGLQLLRGTIER